MVKAQLFSKVVGRACEGAGFRGFSAPRRAKTFNQVTGVGPKGDFDIVSFYDSEGSIVQRVARYVNDLNGETLKTKYWNSDGSTIKEIVQRNGRLSEVTVDNLYQTAREDEFLRQREKAILNGQNPRELMSFAVFAPKRKPRKIIFETKWDGCAPKIFYKNINGGLQSDRLEYLPLIISQKCDTAQINHIVKVQEKALDIEGIAPPIERVPFEDLNPEYRNPKEARIDERLSSGLTNPETGQVEIWNKIKSVDTLLGVIAHEYFHVWQYSCVARLQHNARIFGLAPDFGARLFTDAEIGTLKETSPEFIQDYLASLRFAKNRWKKAL